VPDADFRLMPKAAGPSFKLPLSWNKLEGMHQLTLLLSPAQAH